MSEKRNDPVRPADGEARQLARHLLRTARHCALGVLDPQTGTPMVSRVGLATAVDGTPIILVSALAGHAAGLAGDPRCSLLVGEPGKGDPLAHPRMTVACRAVKLDRDGEEGRQARLRYLAANPKAALYADFADFAFHALEPQAASLNGGFGRAFRLTAADLLENCEASARFAVAQHHLLDWLGGDGRPALDKAMRAAGLAGQAARVSGIDPAGVDLSVRGRAARLDFAAPADDPSQLAERLGSLAAKR